SSGAGRTSDGNGSHASTLKSPSYTKSVSWQHYRISVMVFHSRRVFLSINLKPLYFQKTAQVYHKVYW
ncbi:hypothetical protein ACRWDQ_25030, partial [Escherichia coli]